jgi:aerobic carbon-monoxide dehydrogenase large subunit
MMTYHIGSSAPRSEDPALLRGQCQFLDDLNLPNQLHVAFLRSDYAHAHITKLDVSRAKALRGVHAIITMDDIHHFTGHKRMPLSASPTKATAPITPYLLSGYEVAFVGEAIAMVVAESRHCAEDAIDLIDIHYEMLDVSLNADQSIRDDAPRVRREASSNVLNRLKVNYGDIDKAFSEAAHILSEHIYQHRGCGHPMETRGVIAEPTRDGKLNVWSSTQMPHDVHQSILEVLRLDDDALRVITPEVGGGFGPKYCVYPEELVIPIAACMLKKTLKWVEDRREHCLTAVQERDQFWTLDIAIDAEGHIRGIRGHLVHDQGAYALKAVNLPYNSATAIPGPYIVPALNIDVVIAFTNKVPASSVRGAGYPQAAFAMERLMDKIAHHLGVDRAEIRQRNLIPKEKMPYTKPLKARSGAPITYDSGDYIDAQRRVLKAANWDTFKQRQHDALKQGRYIGIGLANAVKGTGRGPYESGTVRVNPSGMISIYTGAASMGQGIKTTLAQICAERLNVSLDKIKVWSGDTLTAPLGLGGFASRQLVTAGNTVNMAAEQVAQKAKKLASVMLEASVEDLELRDGTVAVRGSDLSVSLAELARILRGAPGYSFPEGLDPSLQSDVKWQTEALAYSNTCHVAEVEVDIELCKVSLIKYTALQDLGVRVNPMIVEGQIVGGIVHGIGNALFEKMIYNDDGQPLTTTFADYLLPTAPEVPEISTLYMETPSPLNPLGVKGVGEVGTIPVTAAVISAIEDALSPLNIRITETPILPERLFTLINDARMSSHHHIRT